MSWTVGRNPDVRRVEASFTPDVESDAVAVIAVTVDTFEFDIWCDGTVADDELLVGLGKGRDEALAWRKDEGNA